MGDTLCSDVPPLDERKLTTVLSFALEWSEDTSDASRTEMVEEQLNECLDGAAEAIRLHGGTVAWFTGRGFTSFFGVPRAEEHAPHKALAAALAIRNAVLMKDPSPDLAQFDIHLDSRIGVNTGIILVKRDEQAATEKYIPHRDAVNLAVRVREMAGSGGIAVTDSTFCLTRDRFAFEPLGEVWMDGLVTVHKLLRAEKAGPRSKCEEPWGSG
jgi:class 3 adenylate cyclase